MKEYFEKREKEVISMYSILFDEEIISRNHDAQLIRDVTASVTESVTADVTAAERENGVRILIDTYKRLSGSQADAAEAVVAEYGYDASEAEAAVKKYWDKE